MMKRLALFSKLSLLLFPFALFAQNLKDDQFVSKQILILKSTKSYSDARAEAEAAAKKISMKLDLRGLRPNQKIGLSFSDQECRDVEFEFPCYVARGQELEGETQDYISVEYSDAYDGFQNGYYIVVAATASKQDSKLKKLFKNIRKYYRDAYLKSTKVYMGCMH